MKFKHKGEKFNFNPDEFCKILKELEEGLASEKEVQEFIDRSHLPAGSAPRYTPYRNTVESPSTEDNDVKDNRRKSNEI